MRLPPPNLLLLLLLFVSGFRTADASDLDTIGYTELLQQYPSLNADGIIIGIAEGYGGYYRPNGPDTQPAIGQYQFNPGSVGLLDPGAVKFFDNDANLGDNTYSMSPSGSAYDYNPNLNSGHASSVAFLVFSMASGADKVEVFDANYLFNELIRLSFGSGTPIGPNTITYPWAPVEVQSRIINQSFIFPSTDPDTINTISHFYDAYANTYGTLFVNGAGNDPSPTTFAPGAMRNGITVGTTSGTHSSGVHIVAPGGVEDYTSFATAYVSGAAAVLIQAAGSTDAADARVIKASLLAGANPNISGWGENLLNNGLDAVYGAGLLNVSSSHKIITGGQLTPSSTRTGPTAGWDLNTLASSATATYFFDLDDNPSQRYSLTATLTWNSITGAITKVENTSTGTSYVTGSIGLNNFDIILTDVTTSTVLYNSALNTDSNIEHILFDDLDPHVYQLSVVFRVENAVSSSDTYALAVNITAVPEPARGLLMLLAAFAPLLRRRRPPL